jgi:hypothetical protein
LFLLEFFLFYVPGIELALFVTSAQSSRAMNSEIEETEMKSNNSKTRLPGARRWLTGTAIATTMAFCGVGAALADPINLMGYSGPLTVKFTNYESFNNLDANGNIQLGTTNFGVFEITSILAGSGGTLPVGTPLWSAGGVNGFLVGTFDNITVSGIIPQLGGAQTENTGGNFAIYQTAALPDFTLGTSAFTVGSCANAAGCYTGISSGTDVLNYNLAPGADNINPADTLFASLTGLTSPATGSASAFGVIDGGSDAAQFGTGGFVTDDLTAADLSFHDTFCPNVTGNPVGNCSGLPAAVGNWADISNDPVRLLAIPEPTSLALIGAGLLGMGAVRRRLRRKKA